MLRPQWEKAIAHYIENGDKEKAYEFAGYNTKAIPGYIARQAERLFSNPKIIERIKELENENRPLNTVGYTCEIIHDLKKSADKNNVIFKALVTHCQVHVMKRCGEELFKLRHDDVVTLRDWLAFVISQKERQRNGRN